MSSPKMPKAFFQAHELMINAFAFDQQGQVLKARKDYMDASRIFVSLLKKSPQMTFNNLWQKEARLCLSRAKTLRLGQTKGRFAQPSGIFQESTRELQFEELKDIMRKSRVKPDPNLSFADVIGLDRVVTEIKRVIFLPLQYPELLQCKISSPRAIMLFGPPGCGKTHLLRATASEADPLGVSVFSVSASQLLDKYLGESQKRIRALFEVAWENVPSIVYVDEFDGIFGQRTGRAQKSISSAASTVAIQIQTELLQYMDGIKTPKQNQMVFIAATNFPSAIQEAQLRRFSRRLYIHPPNGKIILKLLKSYLVGINHSLTSDEFHRLSLRFKGYTPDEIKKVCEVARLRTYDVPSAPPPRSLHCDDITECISMINPMLRSREKEGVGTLYFRKWNVDIGFPFIEYPIEPWEKVGYDPSDDIEIKMAGLVPEIRYRDSLRTDETVS